MIAGFAAKKAYEIAYAVFRVSGNAGNAAFTSYMDSYAFMLLDAAERSNKPAILQALSLIRQFAGFGNAAKMLHPKDSEILIRETDALHSAIAGSDNAAIRQLPDMLSEIVKESGKVHPAKPQKKPAIAERSSERQSDKESRQSKVLATIRQSGNCRMKELQDALPDVSERTLRYDIEELVGLGKLERVGQGGPTISFRIPDMALAMPSEGGFG